MTEWLIVRTRRILTADAIFASAIGSLFLLIWRRCRHRLGVRHPVMKLAVEKARSIEVPKVVAASSDLPLDAPEGKIKFHKDNHHLWKHARIGTFRKDGQIDMIYESPLIEPNPFAKI